LRGDINITANFEHWRYVAKNEWDSLLILMVV